MGRTVSVALAFVGLLVGAGFATGAEVIQFFISFGWSGIWGAVLSGVVFALAGAVILSLGSFFMADEHNFVFRNVSHPVASRLLDASVTVTLFAVGFVMLAGAGSTLNQHYGWPTWVGALAMTALVMVTGLFDVNRVSAIISGLTPLIIVAVVGAFVWTLWDMPADLGRLGEIAAQSESPVKPWFLSALNYNGLALILGVSMCLVIGGSQADPRGAFKGGLAGGLLYTTMLLMACIIMLFNIEQVGSSDVPMLALYESIHPMLAEVLVWIIFGMIYNTSIGMFYALGRRLSQGDKRRYPYFFLGATALGFVVSFAGFKDLMTYVYPTLGYIGLVMVLYLLWWWFRHRATLAGEITRRERASELVYNREHPEEDFTAEDAAELEQLSADSVLDDAAFHDSIHAEVATKLHEDDSVDYEATAAPETFEFEDADPANRDQVSTEELDEAAASSRSEGRDNFSLEEDEPGDSDAHSVKK